MERGKDQPAPRLQILFEKGLEENPDDADAWAQAQLPDDTQLAQRLAAMLAVHRASPETQDRPADAGGLSVETTSREIVAPTVNGYNLIRLLGEGGMGSVYEAEQAQPKRRVALKVARPELTATLSEARAVAEQEALAALEHSGIARLYETGTTEDGRPYFAMELVDGLDIRSYCEREDSSLSAALRIFIDVCRAVQHAHRRGVIHRDLKPSNVLVTSQDGIDRVKVIDFGIAKILDPTSDRPRLTHFGVVGTPAFMSPEQARLIDHPVDTRTDVYSLGVLLYELLTGATPLDTWVKKNPSDNAEMPRLIDVSEILPSQNLLATSTTESRRSWSTQRLPGDLDWIVVKALQQEPDLRYESPYALAEDLERYLADEPVSAGPPTATYRLKKFARRHRWAVAAGSAICLAWFVGAIGLGIGMQRAQRAEARALDEAAAARAAEDFLIDLFELTDPTQEPTDLTATQILQRGRDQTLEDMAARPEIQARLLSTIGRAYDQLGLYQDSREILDEAIAVANNLYSSERWSTQQLSSLLLHQAEVEAATGDAETAESTARRAVGLLTSAPGSLDEARGYCVLSSTLRHQGRHLEALTEADNCLELAQLRWDKNPRTDETHKTLDHALRQRAYALLFLGRYPEFASSVEDGLELAKGQHGPESSELGKWYDLYATSRLALGRYSEAVAPAEKLLALRIAEYRTEEHPEVAKGYYRLGEVSRLANQRDQAEQHLLRAVQIAEPFGESNLLENIHYELGLFYMGVNDPTKAVHHQELAIDLARRIRGANHRDVATNLVGLIGAKSIAGDYAGARAAGEEAIRIYAEVFDDAHPLQANPLVELAKAANRATNFKQAEADARTSIEIFRRTVGNDHDNVFNSWSIVVDSLIGRERFEEALAIASRELDRAQAVLDQESRGIRVLTESVQRLKSRLGEGAREPPNSEE